MVGVREPLPDVTLRRSSGKQSGMTQLSLKEANCANHLSRTGPGAPTQRSAMDLEWVVLQVGGLVKLAKPELKIKCFAVETHRCQDRFFF